MMNTDITPQNKQHGFTLIELLVYMALLGTLCLGCITCLMLVYSHQGVTDKKAKEDERLLFTYQYIQDFIHFSDMQEIVSEHGSSVLRLTLPQNSLGVSNTIDIYDKDDRIMAARGTRIWPVSAFTVNEIQFSFVSTSSPDSDESQQQSSYIKKEKTLRMLLSLGSSTREFLFTIL